MQIVIDIPDHYYENNIKKELPIILSEDNIIAILPKGYGRLIDADALLNNSNIYDIWLNGVYEDCILTDVINNAPTIIEADKE